MIKHFACTGFVVNADKNKALFVHHKKLDKWLPPGGHLEENEAPHEAAVREVFEETGIETEPVLDEVVLDLKEEEGEIQDPTPICVLSEVIPANSKDAKHIHIDLIYLLKAKTTEHTRNDEIHDIRWMNFDELKRVDTFTSIIQLAKHVLRNSSGI